MSLDLYGISVQGAEPYPNPPLLQVPHIHLGVRVVSIFQKKWYLDDVRIDRPIAHIFTDARGIDNLPKLKSSGGNHTDIFALGVRHALLDRGALYYNDKKIRIAADLHDIDFVASFNKTKQEYSGALSYRDGRLQAGSFNPIRHSLEVHFTATPKGLYITNAKVSSGQSYLSMTGTLRDYTDPTIEARYRAVFDGVSLRTILRNPSIPAGIVYADGSIHYRKLPGRPLLGSLIVNGFLNSRELDVHARQARTTIRNIAAAYSLNNGDVSVNGIKASLLGGALDGEFFVRNIWASSDSSLILSLRQISLADLRRLSPHSGIANTIALGGTLTANAQASWRKTLHDLVARANVSIHGSLRQAGEAHASNIPLDGAVHGYYSAPAKQLTLANSYLRMPRTSLTMNGTLSARSRMAVRFTSTDLHETGDVAEMVRASFRPAVAHLALSGTASFAGTMYGPTSAPHITGKLFASDLRIRGTQWSEVRTNVDATPSLIKLENAYLELTPRGTVRFTARAGLTKWSFTKSSPVRIDLNAINVNAGNIAQLVDPRLLIEGTLSATLHAHGTELEPMGKGSISLAHAKVYNQPIQSANLSFTGTDGQVQTSFIVQAAAGEIRGTMHIRPRQKSFVTHLNATGIQLSQLQILKAHNVDARGSVEMEVNGQGTLTNPQATATLKSSRVHIRGQAVAGLTLQMQLANHVATATFTSQAIHSSIRAAAKIDLTGDYLTQASLDTGQIPLQPLLAIYAPAQAASLGGQSEIHATLRGPLKMPKQLEVHVTLPILKLAYGNSVQLAAATPVHLDYSRGEFTLQRTSIRGTDTDLQLQGSIPIGSERPLKVLLLGTMNLQIAQLFNPDIRSSGQLRFNINSFGARADPNIEGQIDIVDANFRSDTLPLGLQHGNGVLALTKNRLDIKSFAAKLGGGTVTAQGGVAFRPTIRFDLGATAQDVRMLYPAGVREHVGANIHLTGTEESALLGGQVQIENLSFTPDFDLTSFTSQLTGGVAAPPSQGFAQNLQLNLAIRSTNSLNLVSRTLSIGGTANIQVRGTAAQPVILGRINLTDGDLIFNGDRFTVNGGTVEFVNPSETEPVFNVSLNTTIQQYNIHLRFNGPVDQLRTNYSSDPSLPPADIIHLLAFGQTTEAGAANPATPANQAAMGLIASQVSSQITSRVAKIAGISQLSINPVLAGGSIQGPAGAVVTIQQRVTGNLFVTFSTNVATTQDQVIMGQYKISPRVSVSVTRDQNGGVAFDAQFNKKW